jgi:hypothetical protein
VFGQHRGDDLVAQVVPRLGVAEEARDVDQDGVEQRVELVRVQLQVVDVVAVVGDRHLAHPVRDAPHQARALVPGEVEAPRLLQVREHVFEGAVRHWSAVGHGG